MWAKDPELQNIEYTLVPSWYDHQNYLASMTDLIRQELEQFENQDQVHIFF